MKKTIYLIVLLAVNGCTVESNEQGKKLEIAFPNPMNTAVKEVTKIQEQAELRHREAKAAEMVKVWVRAKDTRTCMKLLKIDVINNEVIECNRDRYVEVRRDEVEKFKKEQGL